MLAWSICAGGILASMISLGFRGSSTGSFPLRSFSVVVDVTEDEYSLVADDGGLVSFATISVFSFDFSRSTFSRYFLVTSASIIAAVSLSTSKASMISLLMAYKRRISHRQSMCCKKDLLMRLARDRNRLRLIQHHDSVLKLLQGFGLVQNCLL